MAKLARDVMTSDPACCTSDTTLDQVARMMIQNDCGEIPVVDSSNRPIGVVTDRDIVCRIVAEGKNPMGHGADEAMTTPVVTVSADAELSEVIARMTAHRIRRILVTDDEGCCTGIIAQADIAVESPTQQAAQLLKEVSSDSAQLHRRSSVG